MSTKERFVEYLKVKGVGQTAFEEQAGLSRGAIAKKTGFSADSIEKIASACPDLNINWLITGTGSMINNTTSVVTNTPTTDRDIKIIDIRVCAGHGIGFDGEENKITGYVNIPDFTGCYGIIVYGDSMYDMYMPGDTIFVRKVTDWKNIDNGQPHVVITNEDRLLKTIHIDYKEKTTTLSSYNDSRYPDGKRKYPDMMIDLDSDVKHIYKVVGKLARTQM